LEFTVALNNVVFGDINFDGVHLFDTVGSELAGSYEVHDGVVNETLSESIPFLAFGVDELILGKEVLFLGGQQ
jgi:hypothetical protein